MRFTLRTAIPVQPPYALDLTTEALRRLAANVVDVVDVNGTYRRALRDEAGENVVEVEQRVPQALEVRLSGSRPSRWLPILQRMLGTNADAREWRRRVKPYPWLDRLARRFAGVKPPQYPSLFEALVHAIVFQHISIHAAGSIMRRLVEALSHPIDARTTRLYPFPSPHAVLAASDAGMRSVGLSANKVVHLRAAAEAVVSTSLRDDDLRDVPVEDAVRRLCAIRGIGPWSAAVVLLRGFGRLECFPLNDSGVARSIALASGDAAFDLNELLDALGPTRGMLYFHLLLSRIRGEVT